MLFGNRKNESVEDTKDLVMPEKPENVSEYKSMRLVGLSKRINTKNKDNYEQVKAIWAECRADGTLDKLGALSGENGRLVAVCSDFANREYSYFIGAELDADTPVPEGMTELNVPEGEYARFECTGEATSAIKEQWTFIYNKWFPKSHYTHTSSCEVELYPMGDMARSDYHCMILVPVRPVPIRKPGARSDIMGPLPYVAIGGLIGSLLMAKDDKYLIGVVIGGVVGFVLYGYLKRLKDERRKKREEEDLNK